MNNGIEINNNQSNPSQHVSVMLPCSIDKFKEFIAGLLGSPQEIEGGQFGSFSIGTSEINQTYHLITQRIYQQHGVNPIGFTVRIVFNDGTSIQLNSYEDFQIFAEPKPIISTECHVAFSYLIQFPLSKSPEKQDISISFVSTMESKSIRLPAPTFASTAREFFSRGYISYRIKYTARTWGADIEGLLKNHIDHMIEPEPKMRSFMRTHSASIGLIAGVVTATIFYFGQSFVTERTIAEQLRHLNDLFGQTVPIATKLDAIIQMLVSGAATRISELSNRFLMIGGIASLFLSIFVGTQADTKKPSFVLFTKRAEDNKIIELKKYNKNWMTLWISIVGAIAIGIASNFMYEYYAKQAMLEMLNGAGATSLIVDKKTPN